MSPPKVISPTTRDPAPTGTRPDQTRPTVAAAAIDCSLNEATLYRWLAMPAFRAALAQAEMEAVASAGRRLVSMTEAALDAPVDTLTERHRTP